jgi:hypothetical protein
MGKTGVECTTSLRGNRAGKHDVDEMSHERRSTRGAGPNTKTSYILKDDQVFKFEDVLLSTEQLSRER